MYPFFNLLAVPAYPYPIKMTQPDGTILTVALKGDEKFHWIESQDSYVIQKNKNGFFEYSVIDSADILIPSGVLVTNLGERSSTELSFIKLIDKAHIHKALKRNYQLAAKDNQLKSITQERSSSTVNGTKKILCILMGFTDLPFTKTQGEFTNIMNQIGYNAGYAHGSVKDYYLEASYGQLNLDITVVGPYTANHNMAYYGENILINGTRSDIRPKELIIEAIQKANPNVNYADFDNDGDEYVDGVHIIYAGYAESEGGAYDAIWPHKWSIPAINLDNKTIEDYSCSAELRNNFGSNITAIGPICHELGHVLGARDYYDINYIENGQYDGTGRWDVMAQGCYNGNSDYPAHFNPYTKINTFGWATTKRLQIDNSLITLHPASQTNDSFYEIPTTTPGEYFLLENRQYLGFDFYLPGQGMLVWHVHQDIESDPRAINTTHPQRLYPLNASATGNPDSSPSSYGYINSWLCPYPGGLSKRFLTSTTVPGLLSWAGAETGKDLMFINEVGNDITFVVNPLISGPDQICDQANYTYTIDNLPVGATTNWRCSGFTLSNVTNTSVTVNSNITLPLKAYLWADVTIDGQTTTLTKVVSLNTQDFTISGANYVGYLKTEIYSLNLPTHNCPLVDRRIEWYFNGVLVDEGYTLRIESVKTRVQIYPSDTSNSILNNDIDIVFEDTIIDNTPILRQPEVPYANYTIKAVTYNTISGERVGEYSRTIVVYGYPYILSKMLRVVEESSVVFAYPNPSSSILNIKIEPEAPSQTNSLSSTLVTDEPTYDIRLFDGQGNLIRRTTTKEKNTQLDVSDLTTGIYYLHVYDGLNEKPYKKNILIER